MKKLTQEQANKMLEEHKHWINEDCEGWETMRADFSSCDLRGADLCGADLRGAEEVPYVPMVCPEEENAELKEQCSILADCNTCHSTCKNENIEMKKQLTKAKELIEELSSSLSVVGECGEEECELLNRAEQFLNSEVE